jgi:cell division protein FtsW
VAASPSAARKPPAQRSAGPRAVPAKKAPQGKGSPPGPAPRRSAGARTSPRKNDGPSRAQSGKRKDTQLSRSNAQRRSNAAERAARPQARALINKTPLAYLILIPTIALLLLGLVMVFSAGSVVGPDMQVGGYRTFLFQLAWAAFGLVLMVFFAKFDYHKLGKVSWAGVIISFILLALVLFMGREAYGARRWIVVGPLNLQPTEIAKFALVIFSSYVLAVKGDKVKKFSHMFFPVILVTLIGAGLMLAQPDLGSTLVLCFSLMVVMGVAQTKPAHLLAVGATGAAAALFFALSAPYRRARLFSFINPWKSPKGYGYHVIQSYIALGSGNIKGLGLGMSRQKFLYLPNAHTDFIFAIIGEELGIAGTISVICCLAILTYGGFRIARSAPDELGRMLAAGITGLIVIQALVNMGGVTGLLPITGVPLPLVSSGGSSLCVCMGCVGILLNIAAQSRARR